MRKKSAPTWVLTAAHCVESFGERLPLDRATARVGSARNDGGEVVGLKRVLQHPDYGRPGPNERTGIALVERAEPVAVQPIPIASSTPPIGAPARSIGWGRTCAKDTEVNCVNPSRELKQLDTSVASPKECARITADPHELRIRSQEPGGTTCFGDSGSPQIAKIDGRWRLLGPLSRSGSVSGSTDCEDPGASYADLSAHRAWISQHTG
ncbi:trypsin-like serine protease [Allokutzneria sp. NRRL B-24872]|uniref:S1 family peptidase n=1 Tax=Allokutzneria sp. NRRL B-24872 TaxID=1137961 RepID=UPI00143DA6FE|nr:trypsin-like serine protease [Allokutzneria sp. NRRL B-24872]